MLLGFGIYVYTFYWTERLHFCHKISPSWQVPRRFILRSAIPRKNSVLIGVGIHTYDPLMRESFFSIFSSVTGPETFHSPQRNSAKEYFVIAMAAIQIPVCWIMGVWLTAFSLDILTRTIVVCSSVLQCVAVHLVETYWHTLQRTVSYAKD